MNTEFERLYILVRTDLESMNPGKAIAQACHAAQVFAKRRERSRWIDIPPETEQEISLENSYTNWCSQADGFGTVITLGCNEHQLLSVIKLARPAMVVADTILDPTYPLKDGGFVHSIPLITCGFVFIGPYIRESAEFTLMRYAMSELSLHP